MKETVLSFFRDHLFNLLDLSSVRVYKILELVQYTTIIFLLAIWIAPYIDRFFMPLDERDSKKKVLSQIVLQFVTGIVAFYYIYKVCCVVPPVVGLKDADFVSCGGNISARVFTIGVFFWLHAQQHLQNKIHYIIS